MVLCLVRFGGLDREPLEFSTDLGADYGAEAVGVIAAYGFFLIVFVQTVGILNGDQMQTSVSWRWRCWAKECEAERARLCATHAELYLLLDTATGRDSTPRN